MDSFPIAEFTALESLYNATNGLFWRWSFSSATTAPQNESVAWNFTTFVNPCIQKWEGVECLCVMNLTTSIRSCSTQGLDLSNHNLTGSLPNALVQLTNLKQLNLSNNHIIGSLPTTLTNLTLLQTLSLELNHIYSTLPNEINNWKYLQILELGLNNFHGNIPMKSLNQLTNLTILDLSGNFFDGTLSDTLTELTRLQIFDIADNKLQGTIPLPCLLPYTSSLQYYTIVGNLFTGAIPLLPGCYTNDVKGLQAVNIGDNLFSGSIINNYFNITLLPQLEYFVMSYNHLTGLLPLGLRDMISLRVFECGNNSFSGTIDYLFYNKPNLTVVLLENNQFTGDAFPNNSSLSSLTNFQIISEYSNYLHGTLPAISQHYNLLYFLDVGANYITGTIPNWIGNELYLQYLYLNENVLEGSIPFTLGNLNKLKVLLIERNCLTGTISDTIASIKSLQQFKAHDNKLTGTIPMSFALSSNLSVLVLNHNKFTGTIPPFGMNNTGKALDTIDLDSNQLTGSIPLSLFTLPSLQTIILSNNCLTPIDASDICQSQSLVNIVMSGVGTANGCTNRFFLGVSYLSSFAILSSSPGTLPVCLFELPKLTSLYLSANGITGSIPHVPNVSIALKELGLANNILTSSIPEWLQRHNSTRLDLAHNKLNGLLLDPDDGMTFIDEKSLDTFLALNVNRLSGLVPHSLIDVKRSLNILESNLFQCNIQRSNLPKHDPNVESYSCGSNAINGPLYAWIALLLITLMARSILLFWFSKSFLQNGRGTSTVVGSREDSAVAVTTTSSTHTKTSLFNSAMFHLNRGKGYILDTIEEARSDWGRNNSTVDEKPSCYNNGRNAIRGMFFFYESVRYIFVAIMLFVVTICMPIYAALSVWYSTYTYTYAWSISAIFLSGIPAAPLMVIGFSNVIVLVIYLFDRKVYRFSARKKRDESYRLTTIQKLSRKSQNIIISGKFADSHPVDINPEREQNNSISSNNSMSIVANATSIKPIESEIWLKRWSLATFGLFNFLSMCIVDSLYVILLFATNTQQTIAAQLALSVVKVAWNDIVLWQVYPRIKSFFQKRGLRKWCYGKRYGDEIERDVINSADYQFSADEINFMVFTILVNNILIPCLTIALISPHCFYYAFFEQTTHETVTITSCQLYGIREYSIYGDHPVKECLYYDTYPYDVSYNAAFNYRYECSAAFSMKFTAVYIFMFMIAGALIPFGTLILLYLNHKYEPMNKAKLGDSSTGCFCISSEKWNDYMFRLSDYLLPTRWKGLTPSPPENSGKLLANDRFMVRCSSILAIVLAFGVVFPPLAIVAVVSVYVITYFEQFSIAKMLVEAKALKYRWYPEKILKECEHIPEAWYDTLKIILPWASLSFSMVVFDTIGDKYGWKVGLVAAILCNTIPWSFYFGSELLSWFPSLRAESTKDGWDTMDDENESKYDIVTGFMKLFHNPVSDISRSEERMYEMSVTSVHVDRKKTDDHVVVTNPLRK